MSGDVRICTVCRGEAELETTAIDDLGHTPPRRTFCCRCGNLTREEPSGRWEQRIPAAGDGEEP